MGLKGRARFCAMSAEASGERPAKRPRAGKPPLHSVEGARREVLSDAAHRCVGWLTNRACFRLRRRGPWRACAANRLHRCAHYPQR